MPDNGFGSQGGLMHVQAMTPDFCDAGSGSGQAVNLNKSGGFEGMAINAAGDTLLTLREVTLAGAGASRKTLRINAVSVNTEAYTGKQWLCRLEALGFRPHRVPADQSGVSPVPEPGTDVLGCWRGWQGFRGWQAWVCCCAAGAERCGRRQRRA